jgi:hypothetical protein
MMLSIADEQLPKERLKCFLTERDMGDAKECQRFQEESLAWKGNEGIAEQTLIRQDNIAGHRALSLSAVPDGGNVQEGLFVRLQVIL